MGFMFAIGECIICRGMFSFDPERVPSAVINGIRQPICRACVERANPLRAERGLPEIVILPGAYSEREVA